MGHELPEPWAGDRGQGRGEISILWLSCSLLSLATNPLQGKDNKASKKNETAFLLPLCLKKSPAGLISKPQQGEGAEGVENG